MINNYFQNKIVIIYPFLPLEIVRDHAYRGINFRSLNIKPFAPGLKGWRKPKSDLYGLLIKFYSKLITPEGSGLMGFGYSVHELSENVYEKDTVLGKIRDDIELMYYIFRINTLNISTSFPKFYVIDRVQIFEEKDYEAGFDFIEELQFSSYKMIYQDLSIGAKIPFSLKERLVYGLYVPGIWKRYTALRKFPTNLSRAIFWINRANDRERTVIEKIMYSVISLENFLNFNKLDSESFAKTVVDELKRATSSSQVKELTLLKQILIQAYDVRSGIVHGREIYADRYAEKYAKKESDIRVNIDGDRYIYLNIIIEKIFSTLLRNRLSKDRYDIQFNTEYLLEDLVPNKEFFREAVELIIKNKVQADGAGFAVIGKILSKLKSRDFVGVSGEKVGVILGYYNRAIPSLSFDSEKLPVVSSFATLKKQENSWEDAYKVSQYFEDMKITELENFKDRDLFSVFNGYAIFFDWLYYYLLTKRGLS